MATHSNSHRQKIQPLIEALEVKLEQLRIHYEKYFIGVDQRPPQALRQEVARLIHQLEQIHIQNTAQKFRFRNAVQRFQTYSIYWNRILREIENGTYRRHLAKVKRKVQAPPPQKEKNPEKEAELADLAEDFLSMLEKNLDIFGNASSPKDQEAPKTQKENQSWKDLDLSKELSAVWPQLQKPPASKPKRVVQKNKVQQVNSKAKRIYQEFLKAQRASGLKAMDYQKFQRSLESQKEKIKAQYQCRDVDFKVVIKNGRPFIKPIPIK